MYNCNVQQVRSFMQTQCTTATSCEHHAAQMTSKAAEHVCAAHKLMLHVCVCVLQVLLAQIVCIAFIVRSLLMVNVCDCEVLGTERCTSDSARSVCCSGNINALVLCSSDVAIVKVQQVRTLMQIQCAAVVSCEHDAQHDFIGC